MARNRKLTCCAAVFSLIAARLDNALFRAENAFKTEPMDNRRNRCRCCARANNSNVHLSADVIIAAPCIRVTNPTYGCDRQILCEEKNYGQINHKETDASPLSLDWVNTNTDAGAGAGNALDHNQYWKCSPVLVPTILQKTYCGSQSSKKGPGVLVLPTPETINKNPCRNP